MNRYDLIVRGGQLVLSSGVQPADLGVVAGRIVAIAPDLDGGGSVTLDARGLHVLPGVVDAHVHFNDPGRSAWEGWASGSRALAAGGGTLACDMPLNAHPPTVNAAAFDAKLAAATGAAWTDFALWGGLVPGGVDRLDELADRGVIGFKAFMSNSGIDDFAAVDDGTLYMGMARAARLGLPVAVHAESDALTGALARQALAAGQLTVRAYLESRPAVAEWEAISRALLFAEATGCAVHIVHVSTGRSVALVAEAQARGVNASCETCPHYLVLTDADAERLGAVAKCAPPLRPAAEGAALWDHLAAGRLPMIASDHSPAPADMKTGDDFFRVWGGISGCQSLLPLLLTEGYHARALPLPLIAAVTATYPAQRFRLPGKGTLALGADADLALVDLAATVPLTATDLHYRHAHSPYLGRLLRGQVVATLLRGRLIQRAGQAVGTPAGRLIRPAPITDRILE